MTPSRRPAPRPHRTTTALVLTLVVGLLAGCGVRLETPPPTAPTPGADEAARQRASADAAALAVLAESTGPATEAPAGTAEGPVGAVRAAVAADAATHLELLGGLYDDGPADGADGADGPDGAAPTPAAGPASDPAAVPAEAVVAALLEAAATARADLSTVTDDGLARLLGSLAVSRLLSASRLAAAAGLPAPPVPDVVVPEDPPPGVTSRDLTALVAAEDAAGYALEVLAAKHTGEVRVRAGARAAVHRGRAQAWAEAGGVDGTGLDPRRVAYALPGGLEDPATGAALVADLETTLAADYASLVGRVAPDVRAVMADAVAEATAQAVAWGATLPTLPGLPEHANR